MKTNKLAVLSLGAALSLTAFACGDGNTPPGSDDDTSSSTDPTADDSGDGDSGDGDSGDGDSGSTTDTPDECHAMQATDFELELGDLGEGETCIENDECASNFCLGYTDAPNDPDAVCVLPPSACTTRVVGQVLEFGSGNVVAGANVKVTGAISASVNPVGATALAEGSTDDEGHYDLTTDDPVEQPLGIVGIVTGDGYHLSATGLASPVDDNSQLDDEGDPTPTNFYGPANTIRDVWAVPLDTLAGWNAALEGDTELEGELPLGEKGGVIGFARSAETGDPAPGITIVSTDGDTSDAIVRYLNEAGDAFDGTETASSGIFIIVNPGLGENFDALMGGEPTDAPTGTAGSTNQSLFIMIMGV
jgi:hypothetical protein